MDAQKNYKLILNKLGGYLSRLNYSLTVRHALELALMVFIAAVAVSYANREFEIPFFPRGAEAPLIEVEIPRGGITAPATVTQAPAEAPANVQFILNPEHLVAEAANPDDGEQHNGGGTAFESLDYLLGQGFALSGAMYRPEARVYERREEIRQMRSDITAAARESGEQPDFSGLPRLYEYRFAQVALAQTPYAIKPVMDFMLLHYDGRVILADASGRVIDPNFGASGFEVMPVRDWEGRVIFRRRVTVAADDGEEPAVETSYFIYNPGAHAYEPVEFNEAWLNRGPPAGGLEIFRHTNGLWGYRSSYDGQQVITPQFNRAFNFSEGVAAAYRTTWTEWVQIGNRLYFLNENGDVINREFFGIDPHDEDTNPLGFFYFDHGLTRVISKVLSPRMITTIEQREHLIDMNWQEFHTPVDYAIAAYSNGMILLEKDGYFGFMNYLGAWIAQPIYTYARPFCGGVAVIGMADGLLMLIDTRGNIIAPMQYSYIETSEGGIVALYERGAGWTVLSKVRREIPLD